MQVFHFSGVVQEALSKQYEQVQNPELKLLSESLPEFIQHSKAKNTQTKYTRGFERWRSWAFKFNEVNVLPASSIYITLFFLHLIQDSVSTSVIDEAHYGIKWVHEISGFKDPCDSAIVRAIVAAAKRLLSVPVKKKEPVTPEIMLSLFGQFGGTNATLSDLRLLMLCTLGYAGFLRFSELIALRRCDVQFETSFMRLFIERSKTDIYRDGAWVVIAATTKSTCPVALCKRYFALANLTPNSQDYLFRALSFMPSTYRRF
jgi:integrase